MPRKCAALRVSTPRRRREQQKRRRHNHDIHDEDVEKQQPPPQPMPPIILPQAFLYAPNTFKAVCHIGAMTIQCQYCQAAKFPDESKGMRSSNGKIILHPLPKPPPEPQNLYNGQPEQ